MGRKTFSFSVSFLQNRDYNYNLLSFQTKKAFKTKSWVSFYVINSFYHLIYKILPNCCILIKVIIIWKKLTLTRWDSKFCDFLLAKLWQTWIKENGYDTERDFDLLDQDKQRVTDFAHYLEKISSIDSDAWKQFGIQNVDDLQNQLKQSYRNLVNNDINF